MVMELYSVLVGVLQELKSVSIEIEIEEIEERIKILCFVF